ncbi:MAG: aspartate--tRNA ligase, partial [Alphaproteobacteria bacterium]|nr:aspartate--tRNA ligase [Alphaproteobacteria bacterium]
MHAYRTHNCGELRAANAGTVARLSGWVHRKRDHGNLLFVDLRDHFGLTQCVIEVDSDIFPEIEALRLETVICVTGRIEERDGDTKNPDLPTGEVELRIESCEVLGTTEQLPLEVNSDRDYGEEIRLRYRFLDLRRDKVHRNIVLRSAVISSIRRRMIDQG